MVFYFSGTGNSYAAALKIQKETGGELINITDCIKNGRYDFDLAENEPVGIVFPVYYGGLPSIVNNFIEKLTFSSEPAYLYGVLTYGGMLYGAGGRLAKKLRESGLTLSAVYGVRMPANYAVLYEPPHEDTAVPILADADKRLDEVIRHIRAYDTVKEGSRAPGSALSAVSYSLYDKARKTAPFHVNDKCVGCGVCAARCPVNAIKMIDGTPIWVKDRCVFCMSCVRCNAIQYGNKLEGRYRYRNPIFTKEKGDD